MANNFRDTGNVMQNMKPINRKKDFLGEKVQFRDGIKWTRVDEYNSYLFKESYDSYTPFRKINILRHHNQKVDDKVFQDYLKKQARCPKKK